MGKLDYKKIMIFGIPALVIIGVILAVAIYFVSNNSLEISANTSNNNQNISIPNVTEENTKFKISDTKNKVKSINVSAENRLSEYNLYYCLKFDDKSEIKNEDYLVFNDLILLLEENCSILFKYELNGSYSQDAYEVKVSNIETKESENKKTTEEELKKVKVEKKDIKKQSTSPYFIKVNYGANVVTIYSKDKDGNYTVPFKVMVCSCGTYTPKSGTYKTTNKYVWRPLIDNVYGHYATRIIGQILFHSVPYTASSNDTLEYWEYDKLGQTASAGCVRLTVKDAKWIYNNCPSGTMVEFYSSSNPGPLGKPSAQKISSNVECRNWDPTDPASGNPWHTYKPEEKENENIVNNTTTNSSENSTVTENTTNSVTNSNTNTIVDNKPSVNEPTVDEPIVNEPSIDEPTVDKPVVDNPSTDEPSTENPPVDIPTDDSLNDNKPSDDSSKNNGDSSDSPVSNIIKNEI